MEALGIQDPESVIDSDEGISEPFTLDEDLSDGSIIDAEIVEDEPVLAEKPKRARRERTPKPPPREAKSGPPSLDEWTGFFSRVVLKVTTEYYISYAFRGIDEDRLTDREVERLAMTDDERALIATPFAELSNKSKFMRKHGRMIVASGDAFNAAVVFGVWASRVNRIAAKYRPPQPKVVKGTVNGSSGQGTAQATGTAQGTGGGRFPDGFYGPIFPGSG